MFLLCMNAVCMFAQNPTLTADGNTKEYVYPKQGVSYHLNTGGQNKSILWTVSGGSFSATSSLTSISNNDETMTVFWDNVSSRDPKGTINAKVTYWDNSVKSASPYNQKILTLKDMNPPSLTYSKGTTISFGEQTLSDVKLSSQFFYPGSQQPVGHYEWTLPAGWKTDDNKSGVFVSTSPSITIRTNAMGAGTVKVRGVNDMYDTDKSNYSSLTFNRNFSFQSYPSSSQIKYGVEQMYTYTVTQAPGCTFEWSIPSGWTIISGANTNSVQIKKGICATDALVKVRVKAGSEASAWLECPTKTMTYPTISPSSGITQYKLVNVSVDLQNSNIQSFTLSGDGLEVKEKISNNTWKCQFKKSGNIEVAVGVTLNGCSSMSYKQTVSVSPLQSVNIAGKAILCSGSSTYTADVEVAGMTWSVSNLEIVSGQGTTQLTVRKINDGDASISLSLPNYSGTVIYKGIYAGVPYVTSIYGMTNIGTGVFTCYEALPDYNRTYNTNEVNYNWTISSTEPTISPEGNKMCVTFPISGRSYRITCQAQAACGMGMPMKIDVSVGSRYYVSTSSGTIHVKELSEENSGTFSIRNNISLLSFELYNLSTGALVKNGLIDKKSGSIDCADLANGLYVLKLKISDTDYESHKINL